MPKKSRHSAKNKELRKCLPEFFKKHVERILSGYERCLECGSTLRGNISEVAHIAPKTSYKEIMCDDDNVIYLCGLYSANGCHHKFDNQSASKVREMNIFEECRRRLSLLSDKGVIFGYKFIDKYKLDE